MKLIVTGAAGFIGFHVCQALLGRGDQVVGVDDLNPYYDPALKRARLDLLSDQKAFDFHQHDVSEVAAMEHLFDEHRDATHVVHLAAQAGVRHSLIDPYTYVQANVMGQLVLLEASRRLSDLRNFVYASSSSVYGANTRLPFSVSDRVDHPVSLYAATKRAGELVAECLSHLYQLPAVGLRLFTVYGPWGRPDMAAYLFTRAIFNGLPITLFNQGQMQRDFTYIDDIVIGIVAAVDKPPPRGGNGAPHKIYNLGNHRAEELTYFIEVLEQACGRTAIKEFDEMQRGDVRATYSDIEESRRDLGFEPKITINQGLPRFVEWYRSYHGI